MPKTTTPAFTQTIRHQITTFTDTDGTNLKTIATGGTNDSRVIHITISSSDSASNVAFFAIHNGTDSANIGTCNVPNGSGTDGTNSIVIALASTSFLHRRLDNNANPYFELAAGSSVELKLANQITTGAEIKVLVTVEDY